MKLMSTSNSPTTPTGSTIDTMTADRSINGDNCLRIASEKSFRLSQVAKLSEPEDLEHVLPRACYPPQPWRNIESTRQLPSVFWPRVVAVVCQCDSFFVSLLYFIPEMENVSFLRVTTSHKSSTWNFPIPVEDCSLSSPKVCHACWLIQLCGELTTAV